MENIHINWNPCSGLNQGPWSYEAVMLPSASLCQQMIFKIPVKGMHFFSRMFLPHKQEVWMTEVAGGVEDD